MGAAHPTFSLAMADFQPGTVFAGHRIDAVAGRGGMGVVYRATQLALDRTVALKVIAPGLVEDDAMRERFVRESKIAASIDHPNVIPIFYAGEEDGVAYIAMRHVAGDDLRSLVRREGPLAPERAAHIVAQVGAALDAAHAAGLVHRDVKPANVLLGQDDHVYLTDFGLTKHALSAGGQTKTGHWVGTLDYVAPEQIRGHRVDARADVYALGCVLFYALTARVPFDRPTDEARLWAHLSEPPPRATDVVAGLPGTVDGVLARALAKSPDDRYPSAGDLGRAARSAVVGEACPEPERTVAVGSAAPDEAPTVDAPSPGTAATRQVRPDDTPATAHAATPAAAPPGTATGRRVGALVLTAIVGLLALAGGAVALLGDGDDAGGTRAAATATPQAEPTAAPDRRAGTAELTRTIPAGERPNGIAVTGSTVWVMSFGRDRLARIDARTGRRRQGPSIGRGGSDLVGTARDLYVVNARGRRVLRFDARTGRLRASLAGLTGQPVRADLGAGALWIAERTTIPGMPDQLLAVDPRTLEVRRRIPMPQGAQSVRTGGGSVWVLHRRADAVSKLDPRTGEIRKTIAVGEDPEELAYAKGRVWVANRGGGSLSRIEVRTGRAVRIPAPREPVGIDARGDDVWVTGYLEGTLTRIDARRGRAIGEPVDIGIEPYALAVTPGAVWVSVAGDNAVARVDYR